MVLVSLLTQKYVIKFFRDTFIRYDTRPYKMISEDK